MPIEQFGGPKPPDQEKITRPGEKLESFHRELWGILKR